MSSYTKRRRRPLKSAAERPQHERRPQQLKHAAGDLKVSGSLLLRTRQQQALAMLASGSTLDQIAVDLDTRVQDVKQDVAKASDRLLRLYTCSPQHTFIRYAVFQTGIIRRLQEAVERFEGDPKTVQYNSIVSALRAQSDAYDRILEKGLDFGVIERKQAVSAIRKPPADIRNMLKTEIITLSRLLDEVDLSVQFRAHRKRQQERQEQRARRSASTYTPIIRKPLIGPHGVIRVVPDWKYRRKLYTRRADGKYTPAPSRATPEQLQFHQLAQEVARLTTLLPSEQRESTNNQASQQPSPHDHPQPTTPALHAPARDAGWLQPPGRIPATLP